MEVLPNEIWSEILLFAAEDENHVCSVLSEVCRDWNEIVSSDYFQDRLYSKLKAIKMKVLKAKVLNRFTQNLQILYICHDVTGVLHETEEAVDAAYDISRYGFKLTEAEKISIGELLSKCTHQIANFIFDCEWKLDLERYARDALKVRTGLEFIRREFAGPLPGRRFCLRAVSLWECLLDLNEGGDTCLSLLDKKLKALNGKVQNDEDEDEDEETHTIFFPSNWFILDVIS